MCLFVLKEEETLHLLFTEAGEITEVLCKVVVEINDYKHKTWELNKKKFSVACVEQNFITDRQFHREYRKLV